MTEGKHHNQEAQRQGKASKEKTYTYEVLTQNAIIDGKKCNVGDEVDLTEAEAKEMQAGGVGLRSKHN